MRNSFTIDHKTSRYDRSSSYMDNHSHMSSMDKKSYNTISIAEDYGVTIKDDQRINNLITKNNILKTQIRKIEKVLQQANQPQQKIQYGLKLPEIRGEVAEKQLQNAYKLIKQYEYEIEKIKTIEKQGTYATRLTKTQKSLKQRLQIKDKFKLQLQKMKKTSKQYSKSLIDDRTKIILQNKSKKLNDELKMYQKQMVNEDKKREFFLQIQKKKKDYILQLQKKLWQKGVMRQEINKLRFRVFEAPAQGNRGERTEDEDEKIVEDRSQAAYKSLLSEVKLLRKVMGTNEKLLEKVEFEKNEAADKAREERIKLEEAEKEIVILQNELVFLKKHVDPQKLKPKVKNQNGLNSNATFNNATFFSGDSSSVEHYASRNSSNLEHHFEIVQMGTLSKRSEKFNDRKLLGKRSAKIVSVQLYENRMQLLGFQFTYLILEQRIQGTLMTIKNDNQRFLQKKSLNLDNSDYIATVECFVNPKNIIIGIILTSCLGKTLKGGNLEGSKRVLQIQPKEYPGCFYSCISKDGIQLIGVEKIQPQFFEK